MAIKLRNGNKNHKLKCQVHLGAVQLGEELFLSDLRQIKAPEDGVSPVCASHPKHLRPPGPFHPPSLGILCSPHELQEISHHF